MFSLVNLASVGSTNQEARKYPRGSCLIAQEQTKGKGRFNRSWNSHKGGLWMSLVVAPEREAQEYTIIAGLAVAETLRGKLKWPNDVLLSGKKVCGILSELVSEGNTPLKIIVGIGVNVRNPIPVSLKAKATSVHAEGDKRTSIEVRDALLSNFEKYQTMKKEDLLAEYRKRCDTVGKRVVVSTLQGKLSGTVVAIDDAFRLVVENASGRIALEEGDVTLAS